MKKVFYDIMSKLTIIISVKTMPLYFFGHIPHTLLLYYMEYDLNIYINLINNIYVYVYNYNLVKMSANFINHPFM